MKKSDTARRYGSITLLAGAFFIPIFIGAAQASLYAMVFLWAIMLFWKEGGGVSRNPAVPWMVLFGAIAVASIFYGEDPERSAKKIHRLILLGGVLAIPGLLKNRPEDARRLLLAFVCGTTALAIWDVIRIPTTWIYDLQHLDPAMAKLHGHTLEEHKWFLLYDKGNMRDPQFYTFTLLVLFTFFPVYQKLYRKPMMALIALNFAALLLHNKRGAWLALIAGVGLGVLLSRPALGFLKSRKGVAMILLGVLLFGGYSANRWEDIRNEFDPDHGGRLELWSRVFIPFMKDHPWGVGYRALKYEDLQEYTTDLSFTVKNHFHNNGLQIAAELGWLGLIAWAFWMLSHMFMLFRCRARGLLQRAHADRIAHACLLGLFALLCNGMVEYNFGDSEPFMLFVLIMGLSLWLWRERIVQQEA